MLTVLTLLLVLTSGQRFMPMSQAPQAKRSVQDLTRSLSSPLSTARRYWLRATAVSGAAASLVGSTASEGVALSPQAITDQIENEAVLPRAAQPEGYTLARTAYSINQGAVRANLTSTQAGTQAGAQASQAVFSSAQASDQSTAQSTAKPTARTSTQTAQTSLIKQAQDGSWTLSIGAPTETSTDANSVFQRQNAIRAQSVITDLAEKTARTRKACTDKSCRGLNYIESRLPEARETVQNLQAELDDFETHRAQQSMEGYQELLTERIFEIAQQKQDLLVAMEQSQQRITRLKMRLVQLDADLELAEKALDSDATYQSDWNRLIQAEQNLMNEFSQVKVDATDLNEIYSDYQYHQEQAALSAGEALGSYLLQAVTVPSFIERSPDALTYLQDLTTTVHQYRVQKLRQTTISQIEKRLSAREGQLLGDVGEFETLQRELASAQQIVEEYEKEREYLLARQAAQQTEARSKTAVDRVRRLAPLLPKGSVSQRVVYAVLAAGAIATIAARRRRKATVPSLALQTLAPQSNQGRDYSFQPTALQQANLMAAIKLPSLRLSAAQLQTEGAALQTILPSIPQDIPILPSALRFKGNDDQLALTTTAFTMGEETPVHSLFEPATPESVAPESGEEKLLAAATAARLHGEDTLTLEEILAGENQRTRSDSEDFEQRILAELMEITGQTVHMLNAAPEPEAQMDSGADSLTIEMMVKDLNEIIGSAMPEGGLAQEVQRSDRVPAQLSLNDVGLFAEHAVHWILKDLGISPTEKINDAEAQARGWDEAEAAEIEAISIESLEIVPSSHQLVYSKAAHQEAPHQKVPHPVVEKASREFATVAA